MRLPRSLVALAARNRRRLPSGVVGAAIEAMSLLDLGQGGERPSLGLPLVSRVLAIAPHPDDETIGCGGTLARLAAAGAHIEVVLVTDGGATLTSPRTTSVVRSRRRLEAVAACSILGLDAPRCLGLPDGDVPGHLAQLEDALEEVIDDTRPDLLLAPWLLDAHPDHRAVSVALARVVARGQVHTAATGGLERAAPQLWGYEAHTPILLPDWVVDITGVLDRKQAALEAHVTADLAFELTTTLALNRWRSLMTRAGVGAAEAFTVQPLDRLPVAVDRTDRAFGRLVAPPVEPARPVRSTG